MQDLTCQVCGRPAPALMSGDEPICRACVDAVDHALKALKALSRLAINLSPEQAATITQLQAWRESVR